MLSSHSCTRIDFGGGGDDDDEDAANELAPALARAVDDVFSSAGFLVEGFASPRPPVRTRDRDDEAARDLTDALDIVSVDATYDALVRTRRPEVVTALAVALARLLDDLDDALTRYWTRVDDEFDGVTVPEEALYKDEMLTLTRAATIAWRSPLMRDAAFGDALVPRLVGVVKKLPPSIVRDVLVPWLAVRDGRRAETHESKFLDPIRACVERRVRLRERERSDRNDLVGASASSSRRARGVDKVVASCAQVVATLHAANAFGAEARGTEALLPERAYYLDALSDAIDLREEYMRWIKLVEEEEEEAREEAEERAAAGVAAGREDGAEGDDAAEERPTAPPRRDPTTLLDACRTGVGYPRCARPGGLASFCQIPCVLSLEAKSRVLQGEANLQKRHEMRASRDRHRGGEIPFGSHDASFLEISVNRERLLQDATRAVASRSPADLKKPMRVRF